MRKALVSLVLALLTLAPLSANPLSKLGSSLFKIVVPAPGGTEVGTAFCVPGQVSSLMTASHVVGQGMVAFDAANKPYTDLRVIVNDPKHDVAVLFIEDASPCSLSPLTWAAKNAEPGDDAWLQGWGGVFNVPTTVRGIISSSPEGGHQLAQLNALYGHSGSPVISSEGKVTGMLIGVWDAEAKGDEINVIVPVEDLNKVIK